jgi:hypothetical protein
MSADGLVVASTQLGAVDFVEVMLTATEAVTWSRFAGVRHIEVNQRVVSAVDQSIPAPSGSDWSTAGNWGLDRFVQAIFTSSIRVFAGRIASLRQHLPVLLLAITHQASVPPTTVVGTVRMLRVLLRAQPLESLKRHASFLFVFSLVVHKLLALKEQLLERL